MISQKVVNLPVKIFENRAEMGAAAAKDAAKIINETIAKRGVANVVFTAAPSQNDLLENLLKEERHVLPRSLLLVYVLFLFFVLY